MIRLLLLVSALCCTTAKQTNVKAEPVKEHEPSKALVALFDHWADLQRFPPETRLYLRFRFPQSDGEIREFQDFVAAFDCADCSDEEMEQTTVQFDKAQERFKTGQSFTRNFPQIVAFLQRKEPSRMASLFGLADALAKEASFYRYALCVSKTDESWQERLGWSASKSDNITPLVGSCNEILTRSSD